jgi:hypothetical protein
MVVERTHEEVVIRVPASVGFENIQRMVDWLNYKEATAHSQAKQEDVNKIARDSKKGWWNANRSRFIQ